MSAKSIFQHKKNIKFSKKDENPQYFSRYENVYISQDRQGNVL